MSATYFVDSVWLPAAAAGSSDWDVYILKVCRDQFQSCRNPHSLKMVRQAGVTALVTSVSKSGRFANESLSRSDMENPHPRSYTGLSHDESSDIFSSITSSDKHFVTWLAVFPWKSWCTRHDQFTVNILKFHSPSLFSCWFLSKCYIL